MFPLQKDLELIGTFSDVQKAAIINLLYKIGEADGELSDEESIMIAKCNQILKIDLNDTNNDHLITKMFGGSLDELIDIVKPLCREQHEFIIRSVYDVHNAGMAIEKTDVLIKICKGLNVTAEEMKGIVQNHLQKNEDESTNKNVNFSKSNSEFSNTFTKSQKAAVLSLMKHVCRVDGEISSGEEYLFNGFCNMLELDNTSEMQKLTNEIYNSKLSDIMDIINTLNKSQKEWVITCIFSIIQADGKIHEFEVNAFDRICDDMGFSEEEIEVILKNQIAFENKISQKQNIPKENYASKSNKSGCFGIIILIVSISSLFIYNLI